jgi:hypothetical protein
MCAGAVAVNSYDYMFWYEHTVMPIQPGFIDKLFEEVVTDNVKSR